MNVKIPKNLKESTLVSPEDMECGKVYLIEHFLLSTTASDGFIIIDTNDNDVMTFNDASNVNEWLEDNDYSSKGELTPYQFNITVS